MRLACEDRGARTARLLASSATQTSPLPSNSVARHHICVFDCRGDHGLRDFGSIASRSIRPLDQRRAARPSRRSHRVRAGRLGHGRERVRELAQRLADGLAAMGRLADAAAVTGGYLGDVDGAVALLARAREWREARALPATRVPFEAGPAHGLSPTLSFSPPHHQPVRARARVANSGYSVGLGLGARRAGAARGARGRARRPGGDRPGARGGRGGGGRAGRRTRGRGPRRQVPGALPRGAAGPCHAARGGARRARGAGARRARGALHSNVQRSA